VKKSERIVDEDPVIEAMVDYSSFNATGMQIREWKRPWQHDNTLQELAGSGKGHFLVTKLEVDEDGVIIHCLIEAILTRRSFQIDWRELRNNDEWACGWV
jgi:tryptophan-rich hypothetical protein